MTRLSQSAISRIETGTVNGLRYSSLVRILDGLDVGTVALMVRRPSWLGAERRDARS